MNTLAQSILEANAPLLETFKYEGSARYCLAELWAEHEASLRPPKPSAHQASEAYGSEVMFSLAEPEPSEWVMAFTPTFKKSIATADRKLQGRILSAVSELSSDPLVPHGDTIKPLTGDLKGLWRYRVGDFRLIYKPAIESKLVVLLEFAPRGGAYE
jgi:addiction module RelE/StbE family toxin